MNAKSRLTTAVTAICLLGCSTTAADVVTAVSNGFQIKQKFETKLGKADAFRVFVDDIAQWWDAAHSYSGKADSLSIDLEQRCFLETLPAGGFVRHLEIVYYEPGKAIRFTGGLGPLQQMGVCGALTVSFTEQNGKTVVEIEYNVSGRLEQGLDRFATAVDQVLAEQFNAFVELTKQPRDR